MAPVHKTLIAGPILSEDETESFGPCSVFISQIISKVKPRTLAAFALLI